MCRATIHFDGSCWPRNPGGTARAGWHIEFEDGRTVNGNKVIGENSTNNIAEWGALVESLYDAVANGADAVDIYGDSKLVIDILNGQWRAKKSHIKAYRDAARKVLEDLSDWSATWIPRRENEHADRLSNVGIYPPLPNKKGGSRYGDVRHSLGCSGARVRHGRHTVAASMSSPRGRSNARPVEGDPTVLGSGKRGGANRDLGGGSGMSGVGPAGNKYVHAARETLSGPESAPEKSRSNRPSEKMPAPEYCI
jgi:ribonuclease HI